MKILTPGQIYRPKRNEKVICLLGPTSVRKRGNKKLTPWREEAIAYLKKIGFNGVVVVAEPALRSTPKQMRWSQYWFKKAHLRIFWMARNYRKKDYAITTNLEFGQALEMKGKKFLYGRPRGADGIKVNDYFARIREVKIYGSLKSMIRAATNMLVPVAPKVTIRVSPNPAPPIPRSTGQGS